uniref:uncharacterized protein LOC101294746 n=1 Tax=Fragaria vesca subsp. vesca TaxID=101020 RepID=UPI0005CB5745|nr:PREDICTED: uncharacterized protein LOC101294746 [Fragaria vesca subsp. vesca]XP_011462451.1 PREDICTED: uncharacterized protein LOC101294746 [Fragaria vesca subsp. vesca]
MAFPFICVLLAMFLPLESVSAESLGNIFAPVFSPIMDDVCKDIECGKGTCKPSSSSTFFFECQCDSGWKQTTENSTDHFKFLPCVIPNCNLDYSCEKAPAPVPDKSNKANTSIFDPCYWMDCGGGTCNKTSKLSYNCECGEGYYNLLNMTTLPCLKECSIGVDCANLGISVSNKSTSPPTPALADSGRLITHVNSITLVTLTMLVLMLHGIWN